MKRFIEVWLCAEGNTSDTVLEIYAVPGDRLSWKLWHGIIRSQMYDGCYLIISSVWREV